MSKTLMLAVVLLLSAAWLQAQQDTQSGSSSASSPTSSSQAGASQSGSSSSSSQSVEGCLQGSSGNYTLTDKSGATYQLAGDTSKLADHVGHEVKIKGSTAPASTSGASSSSSSAGAGGAQQTLTVESVQHVAKTCKSGSMSK